jgi:GTPase Era involved in 16S rRNA processing
VANQLVNRTVLRLVGAPQSGKSYLGALLKEKGISGYVAGKRFTAEGIVGEINEKCGTMQIVFIDDAPRGRIDLSELIFKQCPAVKMIVYLSTEEKKGRKEKSAEATAK